MAFLASAAFFLLAGAAIPVRHHLALVLVLGGVYVYVVLAAATGRGPLYAVPLAIAGGLAFDSFYIPPTRDFGADDWQNWLVVAIYIVMGVLIGMVGARSQRRAEAAEQAHGLLAEEQAALRRVATMVARQAPSDEVFATVAEEVRQLLGVEVATMVRVEHDGTATVVAHSGQRHPALSVGTRLPLEGENVPTRAHRAGPDGRLDDYANVSDAIWAYGRNLGIYFAVGSPIVVEGRLWGSMAAASRQGRPLPPGTESRIGEFTELVATAISNIEARSDLAASRARIVVATDEARRQFERDLHDGAQQRLVSLGLELDSAEAATPVELRDVREQLSQIGDGLTGVLDELRELSRGIHPAVLSQGGLGPALRALARRSAVPITLDVDLDCRLDERVEIAAYYVVAEALTNVAKHSHAQYAEVTARVRDGTLHVQVRDDGVGGARPDGSGLLGLADRVAVLDGRLRVESPADGGTLVAADIPLSGGVPASRDK
jgi:signal transduction histidine kinase